MTWMLTATGRHFDLAAPRAADVDVVDIAAALSKMCRFGGHTTQFYSVAEHSVEVARLLADRGHRASVCLFGLLHDAHEAYTGDRIRPLKELAEAKGSWAADADALDHAVQICIHVALLPDPPIWNDLSDAEAAAVAHADLVLLATERRDVMPPDLTPWPCLDGIDPLEHELQSWCPAVAGKLFLSEYRRLLGAMRQELTAHPL